MCGIFGYIGDKSNAGELILTGLKFLEYRGYDSWGIAVKKADGAVYIEKHTGKIGSSQFPKFESSIGLGHTRWATHGGVTESNAHPHLDCTKKIILVHNGIIENFEELKKDLLSKGHSFVSETDSETAVHLIEELLKKNSDRKAAVLEAFRMLKGLNAIIIFFPESEEFYAIKNGSPVVFGRNDHESLIASDAVALVPYTKSVYFLEDNELLYVSRQNFLIFGLDGRQKKPVFTELSFGQVDTVLGNYPHYMIKEINEQPQVLQNIMDTQMASVINMADVIKKAYGSYFIGCGSAYYVCLAAVYLFSTIAKRHVNCWSASEFSYLVEFLKDSSLVVAVSQSGETMDVISSVKSAKMKQSKIMAVTNVLGSSLYRMSDFKILLQAGPEICVVSTKVFTAKIAVLLLMAHYLADTLDEGKSELSTAINQIQSLLQRQESIKKLAQSIQNKEHVFILGRGVSYPAALEAALKIKEVSYIHAEGFAAGELKHGVIALIEKNTPVIVFNPKDETYDDTLSSAYEVKARGAFVIGLSGENNPVYDVFIPITYCSEATLIPHVVFAQLLGYHLALEKKYDPDKPRNLAKSVTVK